MKKILPTTLIIILITFISIIVALTTSGVETKKFNKIISQKINQGNNYLNLDFKTIKFKLDLKKLSLFLDTKNPSIYYRNTLIPAQNIKVYVDFFSIIKSDIRIEKIYLVLNKINIDQLKEISVSFKPSNFTSFLNNNLKDGTFDTEIEIYLDNNNLFNNFIARGAVTDLEVKILNNFTLKKTNFSFFADKSDILIKNITSDSDEIKINEGDLKLNLSNEILLESNLNTQLKFQKKEDFNKYNSLFPNLKKIGRLSDINVEVMTNFSILLDKTYKIKNYEIKNTGKIIKANFNFINSINYFLSEEKISSLSLLNSKFNSYINTKKNKINIEGKYSLNKEDLQKFTLENLIINDLLNLKINADFINPIKISAINYRKKKGSIANINLNLDKKKKILNLNKIKINENKSIIFAEGIKFNKNSLVSLKKITVKTYENKKKNNDFVIAFKNNISVNGTNFDAVNLLKLFSQKNEKSLLSNFSKDIEINLANVNISKSEILKNFRLIGKIVNGQFIKISSKGDYGDKNYLDITLKNNKDNNKKYLEIYSDIAKPLLKEFNFFNGLSGGNLLYSSVFDENNSNSKLKIKNFKVINAPGMVKLLSLADLGGLADLAEGEGISFDILEISMEKSKDTLKINEILALGPSISILMEGYQDKSVTSLRGTLVPAKTLNKMISRIPLIGDIVIPKDVGEGLFGISFKMKGPPNNIKTTINPIRTITPRFIQKIIDKNKKVK